MQKAFHCGKFLKIWEYQTTLPVSWETYMWVKKQQSELDMEQQNGSKLGKEYIKAVYCRPVYSKEQVETVTDFLSLGSKITVDGDCSHEKTLGPWKES